MASVGIFDRVAGLPMVQCTYGKVSEVYSSAKERNALVSLALNTVEASVQVVKTSAQPIVHTLEKPIAQADAFACRQFDYLQESVPAIQSSPDEVIEGTKRYVNEKMIEGTKRYVSETIRTSADTVSNSPVGRLIASRVDHVLSATEGAVDYILPDQLVSNGVVMASETDQADYEDEEAEAPAPTPITRLTAISCKVTNRSRALAIKQVNNAQHRAENALEQLRSNLVLITRAQEELKVQRERILRTIDEQQSRVTADGKRIMSAVQDHAQNLRTRVSALPSTVMSSIPDTVALPAGYTFNVDVLIANISQLTASTQTSLQTIAALVAHMPTHLHQPIRAALNHARTLNNMALEISRGNPVTRAMLDQASSLIATISTSTAAVGSYLKNYLGAKTGNSNDELSMDDEDTTVKSSDDSRVSRTEDSEPDADEKDVADEDEEDGVTEV